MINFGEWWDDRTLEDFINTENVDVDDTLFDDVDYFELTNSLCVSQ